MFAQAIWPRLTGTVGVRRPQRAKPGLRLLRELWLARLKKVDQLAERAPEGPRDAVEVDDAAGATGDHRDTISPRGPEG